jgi:hypothetical protein
VEHRNNFWNNDFNKLYAELTNRKEELLGPQQQKQHFNNSRQHSSFVKNH